MSGVAKPQRKFLLTLFVAMLVTRTRLNFLNLSRHSSVHEKTYRRQFRKFFDFASLNQSSIARGIPAENTQLFAQDGVAAASLRKFTLAYCTQSHFVAGSSRTS